MHPVIRLAALLMAAGTLPWPVVALAQPAAVQPSAPTALADAVESAWQRAQAAADARGQQQRAQAEQAVAASLWAAPPAIELSHRDDRWQTNAGSRETEVGLAWPLWLPGQRAAARHTADAAVAQAAAAAQAARLRIAGEVRAAGWNVLALDADAALAEAHAQALQRLADDTERRVRAGDLARTDLLAARAEQLAAQAQLADARQRLEAARLQWTALTGRPAPLDAAALAEAAVAADGAALAAHPELQLALQTVEHARRRIDQLTAARSDPPELAVGVRQDVSGRAEPTANSVLLRIRVPLGTADRNQPLRAAAQAELDSALAAEQRLRARLQAELAVARGAYAATDAQLALENERAALLRDRAALVDRSFRAGETALPDQLRTVAAAAQAERALARAKAALGADRARLNQALGRTP